MSRWSIRPRRGQAAVVGLAVVLATLLAGCGAGQHTETLDQVPDVDGAKASIGSIDLRNVVLTYPPGGVYKKGSTARVELVIVNNSSTPDRLTAMSGASARSSYMQVTKTSIQEATCSCTPSVAKPTVQTPIDKPIDVPIPAQGSVGAYGSGLKLMISGLIREFRSSQLTTVRFTFKNAGQVSVKVPVGTPVDNKS